MNTYKTAPAWMVPYTPNTWSILLFDSPSYGKTHKVFASWYGGFTQGDSWKLSSGIETFVDEGEFYSSLQDSGSIYNLYKPSEKISVYQYSILDYWREQIESTGGSISVVESVNFIKELR